MSVLVKKHHYHSRDLLPPLVTILRSSRTGSRYSQGSLKFGPDVEALSPPELREEVKHRLIQALKKYEYLFPHGCFSQASLY